jgi:hypothetical protein
MSQTYIKEITDAIFASHPDAVGMDITPATRFYEIPGMDSMSIVTFQIELAALIGKKAEAVQPITDMTIAEYSEALESI